LAAGFIAQQVGNLRIDNVERAVHALVFIGGDAHGCSWMRSDSGEILSERDAVRKRVAKFEHNETADSSPAWKCGGIRNDDARLAAVRL